MIDRRKQSDALAELVRAIAREAAQAAAQAAVKGEI